MECQWKQNPVSMELHKSIMEFHNQFVEFCHLIRVPRNPIIEIHNYLLGYINKYGTL